MAAKRNHNKGGRPRKPTEERRSLAVTIKFNEREMQHLRRTAEKSGIHLAVLVRQLALKGTVKTRITPEEMVLYKDFSRQVRGIGQNLNRIAVLFNIGQEVDIEKIISMVNQLQAALSALTSKLN